jgi:hypothetical protein
MKRRLLTLIIGLVNLQPIFKLRRRPDGKGVA